MKELKNKLKIIIPLVQKELNKSINDNKIPKLLFWSYDVLEYDYDNFNGLINCKWKKREVYKYNWPVASHYIIDKINDTKEYKEALKELTTFIKKKRLSESSKYVIDPFIQKIVQSLLSSLEIDKHSSSSNINLEFDFNYLDNLINTLINELLGQKTSYRLIFEISGIVLRVNKTKIAPNVELRRPTKKDLNKLYLVDSMVESKMTFPSAIMTFDGFEERDTLASKKGVCYQLIALLSLFNVGNINCLYYKFESNSILKHYITDTLDMHRSKSKTSYDLFGDLIQSKYILSVFLVRHMRQFVATMDRDIYKLFHKETPHLKVAYEHYKNALTTSKPHDEYYIEKRITETIMGLEALYLTEVQELSFRLKMRISKLFDILLKNEHEIIQKKVLESYDPEKVYERIQDGYTIRNKFAHGDRPKTAQIQKLARKYNGLDNLLLYLLDYLRISIIFMMKNEKKNTIKVIDKALMKSGNEKELIKLTKPTEHLILLNGNSLTTNDIISYYSKRLTTTR